MTMNHLFKRKCQLLAVLSLVFSLLLTAVPRAYAEADTFKLVSAEIPYYLDPTQKMSGTYLKSVNAVESLMDVTPEGEVVPAFAQTIEQKDGKTWEFTLPEGAKFWSGTEVKADQVLAAIEKNREDNPDGKSLLEGISFEKVDDLKIAAKTEKENVNLPIILTDIYIMNADKDCSDVENTDFTGRYQVIEYIPKEKISLVKNEDYWGEQGQIEKVEWQEMPDEDARAIVAQNGDADLVLNLNPTQVAGIEASGKSEIYNISPSGTLSVYMNLQRAPYDDVKVRQAMNWALDRPTLSELSFEGISEPTTTWLGTNPQFTDQRNIIYDQQDLEKAENLMKEAGWEKNDKGLLEKDGQVMSFDLYTFGNDKLLGEAVQQQWMALGIDVKVHHVDYSLIEEARETGDWDGLIETWTNFGDYYPIAYSHFGEDGSANYGHYQSPEVTKALEALNTVADQDQAIELMKTINEQVAKDSNLISLMPRPVINAVNKRVKGYKPHFMNHIYLLNPAMTLAD